MKNTLFTVFISILSLTAIGQTAITEHGQLRVSGNQILNVRDEPAQLQGMSLFWSQWDDGAPFYNAEVIDWLRHDWRIDVIRAAMAVEKPGGYITSETSAEREEAKVRTVVEAAIDLGIYVIIDWHSHEAEKYTEEAADFFARMARDYGDHPNILYEPYNEPITADWEEDIKPYMKTIVDTIRKYDSNNIIICGTPDYCKDIDVAVNSPLEIEGETNIAYAFHYYANEHKGTFRAKLSNAINNGGVPVIISEFGTVEADGDGGISRFHSDEWFEIIDRYNLIHCNWSVSDKDEGASIIKPGTSPYGNWEEDELTESGTYIRNRFIRNRAWNRFPVSVEKEENESQFTYFPNPASDKVFLENHEGDWELMNNTGKDVLSGSESMIDVSHLPEGVYFLRNNGTTHKLIKQ